VYNSSDSNSARELFTIVAVVGREILMGC